MTASLARFQAGAAEVDLLIARDPAAPGVLPGPGAQAASEQAGGAAIRRAATVLLVSHFEGFLKLLVEEMLEPLDTGAVTSKRIPRGVREIHLVPRFSEIATTTDTEQRFALLKKLARFEALWKDDAKPPKGTLDARLVAMQVTNGDSECIDKVFRIFGFDSAICDGDIEVPVDTSDEEETHRIRKRLSDIVQCRNDIAHGDIDRIPTHGDVVRYKAFLTRLATRLDRQAAGLRARFERIEPSGK